MEGQAIPVVAAIMSSAACLSTYMASTRQRLLSSPLNKQLAWIVFVLLQLASTVLLANIYGLIAAALLILMMVMCLWTALVLASAHLSGHPLLVWTLTLTLFSLIMVTG